MLAPRIDSCSSATGVLFFSDSFTAFKCVFIAMSTPTSSHPSHTQIRILRPARSSITQATGPAYLICATGRLLANHQPQNVAPTTGKTANPTSPTVALLLPPNFFQKRARIRFTHGPVTAYLGRSRHASIPAIHMQRVQSVRVMLP